MQQFLMLQLYGIMSSWGEIAVGVMRPSANHPSRSALLGLLAAAIGINRDDDERQRILRQSVRFAVRLDSSPLMMRDYHTVQSVAASNLKGWNVVTRKQELESVANSKRGTIVSTREYFSDGVYTIAVWLTPESQYSLDTLKHALLRPYYTLYFGRKSCVPALPVNPQVILAETLLDAFNIVRFDSRHLETNSHNGFKLPKADGAKLVWWEQTEFAGMTANMVFTRRDDPRSRTRWQFGERFEYHTILPTVAHETEDT